MTPKTCYYKSLFFLVPDFGVASHLIHGIMNVHGILDYSPVFENLDLFGDPSNGEVITVPVKFDAVKGFKKRFLYKYI